ncbi:hypothetical protein [Rhizobium rhizosphaerae]|uniref:hypothetical protein n=1 Tax=Xaviernesmea rhizosphaerae TaxID=1672749 RepID=UPI0015940715|nr:hypothetical protein [Xaviernesmea rhizosphaerae]
MSMIETKVHPAQTETISQKMMNRIENEWQQMRGAQAARPGINLAFRASSKG